MAQGLQIPYVELGVRQGVSSPDEACDLQTPSARRTLAVAYAYKDTAEWQILGTSWLGKDCKLHRHLPERHPGKPWLWATKISRCYGLSPSGNYLYSGALAPDGGPTRPKFYPDNPAPPSNTGVSQPPKKRRFINAFELAVFEVEYTRPPYTIQEDSTTGGSEADRYVEYLPEFQGDYLSIPYASSTDPNKPASLKFVDGSQSDFPGNVGVVIPAEIRRLKWWQVPEPAFDDEKIYGLIGKVNNDVFFDGYQNNPKETMLFMGVERERIFMPYHGEYGWNITYVFKWFPYGHNHFYDFTTTGPAPGFAVIQPKWRKATLGGGADDPTLYEYADMSKIWEPSTKRCVGSQTGSFESPNAQIIRPLASTTVIDNVSPLLTQLGAQMPTETHVIQIGPTNPATP